MKSSRHRYKIPGIIMVLFITSYVQHVVKDPGWKLDKTNSCKIRGWRSLDSYSTGMSGEARFLPSLTREVSKVI